MKDTLFLFSIVVIIAVVSVWKIHKETLFLVENNVFKNDNKASEILYNYLKNNELIKLYPNKCSKENIFAFEYDLNDDDENEIIGYPNCVFFEGSLGKTLYILEKNHSSYVELWADNFLPLGIKISSTKMHKFKNIKIARAGFDFKTSKISEKECIIQYNGKKYIQTYNLFDKIKLYLGE